MKIGIFAKTFPGSNPETVLSAARDAGFDGVQYNLACSGLAPMPDALTNAQSALVADAARTTGQPILALSGTWNMIHPDPAQRALGHRRLAVLAAQAATMGTRLITLCTGTRDPVDQWRHHNDNLSPGAWSDLLTSFEVAIATADRHDILLGVEPELANVVNSAAAARRLIDTLQSPRLRIVLDPANLFETETDHGDIIARAVDLLADRIVMAHAKDRAPDGGFVTAGAGVIDFKSFLQRLDKAGFTGPVVTHGLTAMQAPGVARFLRGLT